MACNLEVLSTMYNSFEGINHQYSWQCHNCYSVNFIIDWDVAWQENLLSVCQNENCKHERCAYCDTSDITMIWGNRIPVTRQDRIENFISPVEIDNLEALRVKENVIQEEFLADLDNLDVFSASNATRFEKCPGGVANAEDKMLMNDATFNAVLKELDHVDPSKSPKAAVMNELPEEMDHKALSEATATPLLATSLSTSSHFRKRSIPCPFSISLFCPRTFTHAAYARTHAKIHTHHLPCPSARCRSRFETTSSLASHLNTIHCLDKIADLPEHCKGKLHKVDGRYQCRFREVLGCKRTFSQNGHANRHAGRHARDVVECEVMGCGMMFMERERWEVHCLEKHFGLLE